MPSIFDDTLSILNKPDPLFVPKPRVLDDNDWIIEQGQQGALHGLNFKNTLQEANRDLQFAEVSHPKIVMKAVRKWKDSDSGKDFWEWQKDTLDPIARLTKSESRLADGYFGKSKEEIDEELKSISSKRELSPKEWELLINSYDSVTPEEKKKFRDYEQSKAERYAYVDEFKELNPASRVATVGLVQPAMETGALALRLPGLVSESASELSSDLTRKAEFLGSTMSEAAGSKFEKMAQGAAASIVKAVGASAAGGAIGLSPAAVALLTPAYFGGTEANSEFVTQIDAGKPKVEALLWAGVAGITEFGVAAIFQKLGAGGLEARLAGTSAVRRGLSGFLKELPKDLAAEIPEEVITETLHLLRSRISGMNPDALTTESLTSMLLDTIGQTIMTVGMGGAKVQLDAYRENPSRKNANLLPDDMRKIAEAMGLNMKKSEDRKRFSNFIVQAEKQRAVISAATQRMGATSSIVASNAQGVPEASENALPEPVSQPVSDSVEDGSALHHEASAKQVDRSTEQMDERRVKRQAQVKEAFPGSEVTPIEDGDGWNVTLSSGKVIPVRFEDDIQVDIDEVRDSYGLSEEQVRGMKASGVTLPVNAVVTLGDGTEVRATELMVLMDKAQSKDTTARHEALHVASELGLFDTKEGKKIWDSLMAEHGSEEAIAAAAEKWEGKTGLLAKVTQFLRRMLTKLGMDWNPEAALSEMKTEKFWAQKGVAKTSDGKKFQLAEEEGTVGIKKASVTEQREKRGLEPIEGTEPQSQEQWMEAAEAVMKDDPQAGERLTNELLKSPRTPTPIETAVLLRHLTEVSTSHEKLSDELIAANDSGNAEKQAVLNTAIIEQEYIRNRVEEAAKKSGEEWARAGLARQIMLREDFSFASLERKARVAKGGESLNTEERAEIKAMSTKIENLQARLDAELTKTDDLQKSAILQEQLIKDIKSSKSKKPVKRKPAKKAEAAGEPTEKRKAGKKAPVRRSEKAVFANVASALEGIGLKFTMPKRGGKGASFQLTEGEDAAEPSGTAEVIPEVFEAAKEMATMFADKGISSGKAFWAVARQYISGDSSSAEASFMAAWDDVATEMEIEPTVIEEGDATGLTREARMIQRELVDAGMRGRERILDAVHAVLQDSMPDITREQTMEALTQYGQYSPASKEETSQVITDVNGQLRQLLKLKDMERGKAPKKTGKGRQAPSDEERMLVKQVNEEMKKGGFETTDPDRQLKTAIDAAKTAAKNRIADLKWEISNKERIVRDKTDMKADAELTALRTERDALIEAHKKIFPARKASKEQRIASASKALDRAITDLESRLKAGDISAKKQGAKLSSPELEAKRARLDALRAQRDALRAIANPKMTPEERARKNYEANLLRRIADYKDRIKKKKFLAKKKPKRELSKEELVLKKKLEDVKSEFYKKAADYHLANLSPAGKAFDYARETVHLSRAMMTSVDMSAVMRQGGMVTAGHPLLAKEAGIKMLKAAASKQAEFESAEAIRNDPLGEFADEAGLSITSEDGKLNSQEEAFRGRWAKHVPLVAGSGRAYATFMNNLRFGLFKMMVTDIGRTGSVTKAEARVLAQYINAATGRADLKMFEKFAENASLLFFAPRYVVSRFQYLATPFMLPFMKTTTRIKKAIAMEYARSFSGAALFVGTTVAMLSLMSDDDEPTVEFDPRSSDFLKIRIGETRLDLMAGLSQAFVASSRIVTGQTKKANGKVVPLRKGFGKKTRADLMLGFLRTKLAPMPGAAVTIADDWTNVVYEKKTAAGLAIELFIPLSIGEVAETMKAQGFAKGTALSIMAIFGAGIGTYGPKTRAEAKRRAKK